MGHSSRTETHVAYVAECPSIKMGFSSRVAAQAFAAQPGPYWLKFRAAWVVTEADDPLVNRPWHDQEEVEFDNRFTGDPAMLTRGARLPGFTGLAYDERR